MTQPPNKKSQHLAQRIWLAYLRAALVPLLLVEVVLIFIYVGANKLVQGENSAAMRTIAVDELARIASREAVVIDTRLAGVRGNVQVFAEATRRMYDAPLPAGTARAEALARYATAPGSNLAYSLKDTGGGALYYSGITPKGREQWDKILRSEQLDPLMKPLVHTNPLVVQVYLNTFDSMNRIYPFIDVVKSYDPKMDIPKYNFYYEADLAHDPTRRPVWTDVYVDPAGQGWMASCIAPVYRGSFLEGVVGFDITVATLVKQVLDLKIPWHGYGMLIGKTGTILALPADGETDFRLTELKHHDYQKAILQDTFKPENFNLYKRKDVGRLAEEMQATMDGIVELHLAGGDRVAAWSTVRGTGWKLLVIVPRSEIYQQALTLSSRLGRIALFMVFGLVVFYAIFFFWLNRRSNAMARELARPLARINDIVAAIGEGAYQQAFTPVGVHEIDTTAAGVVRMGHRLAAHAQELRATEQLFEELFRSTPQGLLIIDESGKVVQTNRTAQSLFGYGEAEFVGKPVAALVPEAYRLRHAGQMAEFRVAPTRRPMITETGTAEEERIAEAQRADGERFLANIHLVPLRVGGARNVLAAVTDVTKQVRDAQQVARSLAEKETLLKEIHHRVKNNLQIISSLLTLQSEHMPSEDARAMYEESVYRIRSMALIHEQLYGADSLERVDLGAYVHTLGDSLRSALAPHARLDIRAEAVDVAIDTAVPLGLILNELLTNALKYGVASASAARGEMPDVNVEIVATAETITVEVFDHGPGLPVPFDIARTNSLGLQLVRTLARQLRADLRMNTGPGARFTLEIPREPRN